ncbi:MAG: hypothetical protein JW725_00785, partial [Candidatus Babeliaceae bacterium]|nr:hypothetical protein [Candidatus Babeliaceae bacterium]
MFGKRKTKYSKLLDSRITTINWQELFYKEPYYFFIPKDYNKENKYHQGFQVNHLIPKYSTGIETKCDDISVQFTKAEIVRVVENFSTLEIETLESIYKRKSSAGWNYKNAKNDILDNQSQLVVSSVAYRPFDERFTAYTGYSGGFLGRPRSEIMKHLLKTNLAFCSARNNRNEFHTYFVTETITDKSIVSSLDNIYIFPLYLYPDDSLQQTFDAAQQRKPNFSLQIIKQIVGHLGIEFVPEKVNNRDTFAPVDLFDYIYAVLHSPLYRKTYKEFLKIDFPRIPYPRNADTFWQLVAFGGELRQLHLLESPNVEQYITTYPQDGHNIVTRKMTQKDYELHADGHTGRVWINDTQYFDNVSRIAWEFYIGGYQPAQKWLKDRQGRELSFEDIRHYQKIIVALTET